jgi:hypothetical protein
LILQHQGTTQEGAPGSLERVTILSRINSLFINDLQEKGKWANPEGSGNQSISKVKFLKKSSVEPL